MTVPPSRYRHLLAGALRYVFAIAACVIIATTIDVSSAVRAIADADAAPVILGIAIGFVAILVNSWKWWLLARARGLGVPLADMYQLNLIANLYGLILPGQIAGEAIKVARLIRHRNQRVDLVASVAVDRFTSLLGYALLALIGALWLPNARDVAPWAAAIAAVLMAGAAVLVTRDPDTGFQSAPHDATQRTTLARVRMLAASLRSSLAAYRNHRGAVMAALALSCLFQLIVTISVALFARALGIDIAFTTLVCVFVVVSIVQLLPVSIAGIGARDGTMVFLLGAYGVPAELVIALSTLVLAMYLTTAAAGLLAELMWLRQHQSPAAS